LNKLKKIVVIGPESTGKSTLCYQLAQHFKSLWVPEFARQYLEKKGPGYSYDDLLVIAKGQIALEDEYIEAIKKEEPNNKKQETKNKKQEPKNKKQVLQIQDSELRTTNYELRTLFIDTDMYVMQVWCEFAFGRCHNWILQQIAERRYDLYLLCNVDLPWIKDELREYPDPGIRKKLYRYYKEQMLNQYIPWIDISGNYEQRLQLAIDAIENKLY
jgi:nicotinamide riboside kinase